MFPPASQGPPTPPPDREMGGTADTPPMPPSMLAQQGERKQKQDQTQIDELSKKTVEIAVTKLMEVKNAMDGLNTAMRTLDPSSDALIVPMISAWQQVATKVKEVIQRVSAGQPNMAGKPSTPGAMTGSPAGQAGPGEGAAGPEPASAGGM